MILLPSYAEGNFACKNFKICYDIMIIINNLFNVSRENCQVLMYADDAVIYTASQSITDIERALTSEMKNISKWLANDISK